jgi:HlyD family secretion protein
MSRVRESIRKIPDFFGRFKFLRKRSVLLGAAGVAVLLAVALWPRASEVDLSAATTGTLMVTVDEEGETRVHERYTVSAPVSGEIRRIELEPGDRVEAGRTVLAQLRPSSPAPLDARVRAESEASVHAAQAALGRARAERERAAAVSARSQARHERLQQLFAEQVISRDTLETQQADAQATREALRSAEFAVSQARHQLTAASARMIQDAPDPQTGDIVVLAPVDGVVLKRLHESRSVVSAGAVLIEIGDVRQLEIVSDLLSSEAVKVSAGDAVLIEQWGGGKTLRGRVRRVEPAGFLKISALGVEEQRVNVIIDFEDPAEAWKALGDAYRVEVRVVIWQRPDVLKLPIGSLFRAGDDWAAFVADGGRARLRKLEIGQRNSREAQVLGGLRKGERVVLYPSDDLRDGARIVPRDN